MIHKITLKNWKNHLSNEFEFDSGSNSLIGNMGSGKSSILQAISFALFGTFSELKERDIKLTDVVNNKIDSKEATVTLHFNDPSGNQYIVKRKISKNGSEAILTDSNGKKISGPQVQEVNSSIEKILEINQKTWLRTVYARQNEIGYFLKIPPLKRKQEIDELMGLNKFEKVRSNSIRLINKLKTLVEEKSSFLEDFDAENLNKNIDELSKSVHKLRKEKIELNNYIKKFDSEKEKIRKELENKKDEAKEANKLEERFEFINEELKRLKKYTKDRELENKEDFSNKFELLKKRIKETQSKKEELKEIIDEKRELFSELEKELSVLNERLSEVERASELRKKLKENLSEFRDSQEELNKICKQIESKKSSIDLNKGKIDNLKANLIELKKADNKCPVCSNNLDENKKEELIEKRNQEIENENKTIEFMKKELDNLLDRNEILEEKNENRKKIVHKLESLSEKEYNKEDLIEEINELNKNKNNLKNKIEKSQENFDIIERNLKSLNEKFIDFNEKKTIYEKLRRFEDLQEELKSIELQRKGNEKIFEEVKEIEEIFEKAVKKVQEMQTKKEYISPLIEEKKNRLNELLKNKEEIDKLKREIDFLSKKIDFLNRFKNAVITAQLELRRKLILAVNEIMADIWKELYPYEKWNAIRLYTEEDDYSLQIKDEEERWLPVTGFASGGERMVASLTLRIAFSKILAPKLDLLILDEPTHNLDKNAIETLNSIIENKLSKLLKQTFIITHEETVAESAENLIKIK